MIGRARQPTTNNKENTMKEMTRYYSDALANKDPESYGNFDACEDCDPKDFAEDAESLGDNGVLDNLDRDCAICGHTN